MKGSSIKTTVQDTAEASEANDVVIEIQNLKKSFRTNEILKGLSLRLYKGENLVILGKSGTGKTVLIKCIVKLVEPDEGTIQVLENNIAELDPDKLNELRKRVGFLFQGAALYDSMTVRQNLEFPLRETTKSEEEKLSLAKSVLENVGLADAIDKWPSELSGGMRKRIGLARTLILEPDIMLYDEPTTGLDPVTAREISKLIVQVQEKFKTSSIIITHDIECARITANRIIVVREGICVAEGTVKELEKSEDEFVRSFFE